MNKDEKPVIVKQAFDSSIESVWNAVTNINQMRQWYFDNIPAFSPEPGFETSFYVSSGSRNFLHMWKVIEAVPNKRIKYTWKYDGCAGDSFVVFELSGQGDLTELTLTHQILEDFQDSVPEFTRESCEEGWKFFIQKSLKEFLEHKTEAAD
jgi:uncharacterized protein YndB with AHSA1/START domain